ncbi:hypothetical protein ACLOJK_001848 [Asimina triloba]
MLSASHFKTATPKSLPFSPAIPPASVSWQSFSRKFASNLAFFPAENCRRNRFSLKSSTAFPSERMDGVQLDAGDRDVDCFVQVGNKVADAAGEVTRKYFRKKFEILDKEDLTLRSSWLLCLLSGFGLVEFMFFRKLFSADKRKLAGPVTIADRTAEEAMTSIILENFPSHAVRGKKGKEERKKFLRNNTIILNEGKPLFGTLIALLYKGKPIVGIIDQPVLRERWIGISGRRTTLNGQEVSTRSCSKLSQAYLYTTSPHLFGGDAVEAFARVRDKVGAHLTRRLNYDDMMGIWVKVPLYGCDCYAYALLASGYVDLVVESGLKPYDFLSLIPVIEGAGGLITNWKGEKLFWEASPDSRAAAAGDAVKQLRRLTLNINITRTVKINVGIAAPLCIAVYSTPPDCNLTYKENVQKIRLPTCREKNLIAFRRRFETDVLFQAVRKTKNVQPSRAYVLTTHCRQLSHQINHSFGWPISSTMHINLNRPFHTGARADVA